MQDLIDRYGQHTLEMHFRLVNSLSQDDAMQLAGFSGLDNIGNTCYMNAVLQALFHTPLFREYYLSK
jgi:ubiquitin C-terminal hydrolase